MRTAAKVAVATAAAGLIHSLLASRKAKRQAAAWVGERQYRTWYRAAYLGQSAVMFGGLAWWYAQQPNRTWWHVQGWPALLLRGGQAATIGYALWSVQQIGAGRLSGAESLLAGLTGRREVPEPPEAQGPALQADGTLGVTGPFRASRHPLELAPLVVFWLEPRMTRNWAVFSAVSTVYSVLAAVHAEARLRAAYGAAYEQYERSDVPFLIPTARQVFP